MLVGFPVFSWRLVIVALGKFSVKMRPVGKSSPIHYFLYC